jgi:DNA replication protein DnaC
LAKIEADRQAAEAARIATARQDVLLRALPAKFARASWDSLAGWDPPIPPSVITLLDRWCDRPATNLVILGDPRIGKSWVAAACLSRVIRPNQTVAWWSCSELLELARERPSLIAEAAAVHWLVLDDLGTEYPPYPVAVERIGVVFNKRDQAELPTVVTSSLDKEQLASWVGPRTFARLREGVRIQWTGPGQQPGAPSKQS